MKSIIFCTLGLLASQFLFAQADGKSVLVNAIVKHWEASKDLSLAVANAMPEDSYAFKATDGEMSFGEQINHIGQGNLSYCGAAFSQKPANEKSTDNTKPTAIKNLTAAYDYCIAGAKKLTDADLTKEVARGGKPVSVFELLWGGFTHSAHHRGQAEVYLRLKGVTPPSYKF